MEQQVAYSGVFLSMVAVLGDELGDEIINCYFSGLVEMHDARKGRCDFGDRGKIEDGDVAEGRCAKG